MSRNELFTAITRSVDFENVSFTDRLSSFYPRWIPTHRYLLITKLETELIDVERICKIYFIDLGDGVGYVGITERELQQRMKEHIRDRKRLTDSFHKHL
jgi:hypothetical protein